jgi:hypothetical protein
MASGTTKKTDEYVRIFYGIHNKSYEFKSVWLTRGGTLSSTNSNGQHSSYKIGHAHDAKNVVANVFGLTDVLDVSIAMIENTSFKKRLEELEAKASAMKAVAEKDKT